MMHFQCRAILFDLDGVLVDSSAVIRRHWHGWAERQGLDPEESYQLGLGKRTVEQVRMFAPHLDAETEASKIDSAEAVDVEGVEEVPGARELLKRLPAGSWGIVTSGTLQAASTRIGHVGIRAPEVFITSQDVAHGKPDPEAYLLGAQRLGVSPGDCLVIEDSASGVAAAKAAGMGVIGLATTHPPEDLESADAVVRDLSQIEVALVREHPKEEEGRQGRWIELQVWVEGPY
jgi:sugar-phosphatase